MKLFLSYVAIGLGVVALVLAATIWLYDVFRRVPATKPFVHYPQSGTGGTYRKMQ